MAPTDDSDAGLDAPTTSDDDVPDFGAARRHVLIETIRLAGMLRREGVPVPTSGSLAAARALATVGLGDRDAAEAALRATLVSEASDLDAFDEAFPEFWHRLRSGLDAIATDHDGPTPDGEDGDDAVADAESTADDPGLLADAEAPEMDGEGGPGEVAVRIPTERRHVTGDRAVETGEGDARRYSAVGEGGRVDVDAAELTAAESAAVDRFVDALATLPGRRRRASRTGERVDARRALRASLETGGAAIDLPRREPTPSELRCCLLVDVSGSVLDTVDRSVLLAFAERLHASARDARIFLFDTDLREVTTQFDRAGGDPAGALRDAAVEWGGGTEIGGAFTTLRRDHPHTVDRRTAVVVVSDGLDVGDEDVLKDGVTWLADRAGALLWLNPLAVSPQFAPRSRGMATSEPYVDALFGFAEPADLGEAARQLERRGLAGPVGYEYDRRRRAGGDGS
ncbi:VWA domain-containing protein [Haloplanus rubicundus]|uniref:VWA domain-containing protein n=1 Tax=Haloplanus rubicundus TaxID=1547898 RepID=A0A345E2M6_9EURY|nr:VWA domain-containing protein [Haloplanus rubicundus]AXG06448.1 VWA domain-containing protein [Haloplanus rubicundus]